MIKELVLSIAITWIIVKIIKTIIQSRKKGFGWKALLYDGGMPSSHTVLVVSLATGLYLETGFSYLFIISVVLALTVMWDAMNVRMKVEQHAKILNKLQKDIKLSEHVGHKPIEVLVALIFGIIIPIIIYTII